MKRNLVLFSLLIVQTLSAQHSPIEGSWKGYLEFAGRKMDIVIDLKQEAQQWRGSLSSEKQQLKDIPLSNIRVESDSLFFDVPMAGGQWKGYFNNQLTGHWIQGAMKAPLNFEKLEKAPELKIRKREQTPLPPFPYLVEEVQYKNPADGTLLAATLTIPEGKGPFPAAILLSVAGPNDRDQSHGSPQHKPFMVLADHLTKNGIAVLRADDRGVGGSTGNLFESTIVHFAQDALAGFEMLQNDARIKPDQIGFIGNSEGTLVGPLAASLNEEVAFIVTLGGMGVTGSEVIMDQVSAIGKLANLSQEEINQLKERTQRLFRLLKEKRGEELEALLREELIKNPTSPEARKLFLIPESISAQIRIFKSPWYRYQISYDPRPVLEQVKCPFLALHGDQDPFVAPDKNLEAIEHWLKKGRNTDFKGVKFKNVNHVFQDATDGSPANYSNNENSFSPRALETISQWLKVKLALED